jgi:hypothetical protein
MGCGGCWSWCVCRRGIESRLRQVTFLGSAHHQHTECFESSSRNAADRIVAVEYESVFGGRAIYGEEPRAWYLRRVRYLLAWGVLVTAWGLSCYELSVQTWDLGTVVAILYFLFLAAVSTLQGVFFASYVCCFLATPILMLVNPRGVVGMICRVFELTLLWPSALLLHSMLWTGTIFPLNQVLWPYHSTWIASTMACVAAWILPTRLSITKQMPVLRDDPRRGFSLAPINFPPENPPAPPTTLGAQP